ncbi:unnamed protein product [marine sediment metagenome]|uniref:Uncharacterized protein n=1 Tax=marine sediment metagenome TaxID=412755 RepID=X1F4G0_9ZZZZ
MPNILALFGLIIILIIICAFFIAMQTNFQDEENEFDEDELLEAEFLLYLDEEDEDEHT